MRREEFTLAVVGADEGEQSLQTLAIESELAADTLGPRLEGVEGTPLDSDQVDVSFRFTSDVDADDPTGVLALADRLTGEFLLELNADGDTILSFVREARRQDEHDDGQYRVSVRADDAECVAAYEKATFLVYNSDGDLLREHSLIPGGVEL